MSAKDAEAIIAWLKRQGSKKVRDGMTRYGLPTDKAFGVGVGAMQKEAKRLGKNHDLATELWATGWYEARMMAAYLGEPNRVTATQMDRWAKDFDNWGICDTVCFALFDRTPHAWRKVSQWAPKRAEFVRRGAFALLASLVAHDKEATDQQFVRGLELIERGATDERNFVKKGVSWALRSVGKRNPALNAAAVAVSRRLAGSANPAAKWVGREALRDLTSTALARRLAARRGRTSGR